MKLTNVFIISSHRLFTDSLTAVLRGHRGVQVVGVADDTSEALSVVETLRPDVVIVDSDVPSSSVYRLLDLDRAHLKLIHVTLEHNRASVYTRDSLETVSTDDLVAAIKAARSKNL